MRPIRLDTLSADQPRALDELYHRTRDVRVRTRAQMILLAAEQGLVAAEIAPIVRQDEETVRRWFARYAAEGLTGLSDAPRPGTPPKVTPAYRERLLQLARRRPRALGLPLVAVDSSTPRRPSGRADRAAPEHPQHPSAAARRRHGLEPAAAHDHRPRSRLRAQKKTVEGARDHLRPDEVFYYVDEFNISWHPTLRAMWSPKGRQVTIPTPMQPTRRYGLGAVDRRTSETVVITRSRKRRREVAELLEALLVKRPHERVYLAWDNASTHEDEEVEAVLLPP